MTTRSERQKEAFDELKAVITGGDYGIDFILVEGTRDVEALRFLGVTKPIDILSHVGHAEHDIAALISRKTRCVLVLTDFDEKGLSLARRITELLAAEGVQVQIELRRKVGYLMSILGLKTVEALDNWESKKDIIKR